MPIGKRVALLDGLSDGRPDIALPSRAAPRGDIVCVCVCVCVVFFCDAAAMELIIGAEERPSGIM